MADHDKAVRDHVLYLLGEGGAHAGFEDVMKGIPPEVRGKVPKGAEHSLWDQLEHLRLAQWDILEFSRNPKYESPKWPEGYWPESHEPPSDAAWNKTVKQFRDDLQEFKDLVANPKTDIYAKIPHGDGQTILREALLAADHNAYHLGEMVLTRRLLGVWK